ncbi:MAG: hypothetical protein KDD82_11750 [Planctomycetes bacterium]|nr:hypothetical protein [Planctomycetota bacterium]
MTRLISTVSSLALVFAVSLAAVGCRDSSSRPGASPGAAGNAGPPSSNQNPSGPPGAAPQAQTVAQLTGDPDDQVSPQLQGLVAQALARGDSDDPLEGF